MCVGTGVCVVDAVMSVLVLAHVGAGMCWCWHVCVGAGMCVCWCWDVCVLVLACVCGGFGAGMCV